MNFGRNTLVKRGRVGAGIYLLIYTALSCASVFAVGAAPDNALDEYVNKPDPFNNWKYTERKRLEHGTAHRLELVSQAWRGKFWSHHMIVFEPDEIKNRRTAFLLISGDGNGEGELSILQGLAKRAKTITAVITKVPNQPLYDGRYEDALIAFTFDKYIETGDRTWPLLFPMVKSAVRGMDVIEEFSQDKLGLTIESFVLSGASKRGWTTWLTAAADNRVQAIAPMVIDMLNMKVQMDWAKKAFGKESESIHDYSEHNLIERMDEPRMKELRSWVDPYSFRDRYSIPKLILLGTNDPYWVVDSLRHYWRGLPEPKHVFQTPNAGHGLNGGNQALQSLAGWLEIIVNDKKLPEFKWDFSPWQTGGTKLSAHFSPRPIRVLLWSAESSDRDFRDAKWRSREIDFSAMDNGYSSTIEMRPPADGYTAFMLEATFESPSGHEYGLSTEARVVPDDLVTNCDNPYNRGRNQSSERNCAESRS
ncbi:MAG: PhoPQ-activated pathogenicity-related family protein [Verrucomicrobia bacterium]|nr:PhoPQ-activated pathogenicity-related family protein [Verrucomicrobiota bacterium]